MKKFLFVSSHLEEFPIWKSVDHAEAENYPVKKGSLYIHKIMVDDLEAVAEKCRYGAPVGKAGSQMLWGPDLTWWLSENPKAYATGFGKPQIDQIPFQMRPKRDQLTEIKISRAHLSPGYDELFGRK
jgi:hypothetical protein